MLYLTSGRTTSNSGLRASLRGYLFPHFYHAHKVTDPPPNRGTPGGHTRYHFNPFKLPKNTYLYGRQFDNETTQGEDQQDIMFVSNLVLAGHLELFEHKIFIKHVPLRGNKTERLERLEKLEQTPPLFVHVLEISAEPMNCGCSNARASNIEFSPVEDPVTHHSFIRLSRHAPPCPFMTVLKYFPSVTARESWCQNSNSIAKLKTPSYTTAKFVQPMWTDEEVEFGKSTRQ